MTDRARAFADEIREALDIGVTRDQVAEVVRGLDRDIDLDPMELRVALMQYAPVTAFHVEGAPPSDPPLAPRLLSLDENDGARCWAPGPPDTRKE